MRATTVALLMFALLIGYSTVTASAAPHTPARHAKPKVVRVKRKSVHERHLALVVRARRVAIAGGITGTCWGCATEKTRALVREVFAHRFASAGTSAVRTALCLIHHESGDNPGAISSTGDYSAAEFNRATHEAAHPDWYKPGRGFKHLIFDPAKSAGEMWAMSRGGRSWTAWTGTYGRGLCHNL